MKKIVEYFVEKTKKPAIIISNLIERSESKFGKTFEEMDKSDRMDFIAHLSEQFNISKISEEAKNFVNSNKTVEEFINEDMTSIDLNDVLDEPGVPRKHGVMNNCDEEEDDKEELDEMEAEIANGKIGYKSIFDSKGNHLFDPTNPDEIEKFKNSELAKILREVIKAIEEKEIMGDFDKNDLESSDIIYDKAVGTVKLTSDSGKVYTYDINKRKIV